VGWIKNNYVDYVVPQVYLNIGFKVADYSKLVSWWSNQVKYSNVKLYIGQGIYKDEVAREIDNQLELNDKYDEIKGSVFFSTSDIINNKAGCRDEIKNTYTSKSRINDIDGHWAKADIEKFIKLGYVNGYEDNTFRPENQITRAEFIKLVNRVFNLTEKANPNFKDISSQDWYYEDLRIAVKYGYINGYEDNTFRADNPITRQEAMKIITTLKNNEDVNLDKIYQYSDFKDIDYWAKEYVEGAIESGYIRGDENKLIKPKGNITRAESVTMLNRLI
ncbi:MAG: S-layer homology domain-containing protein, partial [Paeniclostridium sp.]